MSDTATPPETTTPPAETPPENITRRPLNRWRSHKVVDADKIASIDANVVTATEEEQTHRLILGTEPDAPLVTVTQAWFERHRPQVGGYFVRYSDDYESYSPADSFEKGYNPFETEASTPERIADPETPDPCKTRGCDFGEAVRALKDGLRVAREGWNGKGMWLSLTPGIARLSADSFWSPHNKGFAMGNGGGAEVLPSVTMKTADNKILMGWLASQSDMLAEDWIIMD